MEFREATRLIISQVEKVTGLPVHVKPDPALQTLAAVALARKDAPSHVISFNPTTNMTPDYHICFQCGSILRLYACPPEARLNFVLTPQGRREVEALLKGPNGILSKMRLPPPAAGNIVDEVFRGAMLQLRSMPIGMRVDKWLRLDYPDLNPLQEASARKQMQRTTPSPSALKFSR